MGNAVVSHEQWVDARRALLAREKELSQLRDELARARRALPWEKVTKEYLFDTASGRQSLAGLFGAQRQLIVYHFMFGPGWQQGCPSCSFLCDHVDGALPHLAARGVAFVAVSRAPLAQIQAFQARMGWRFPWVSSAGSDFNYDFGVSFTPEQLKEKIGYNYREIESRHEELPGASAFCKDDAGTVFHTYSTYARGLDLMIGAYNWLDIAPRGRDEDGLPYTMAWVRHHDRYGQAA